jgi:hypothetical protein
LQEALQTFTTDTSDPAQALDAAQEGVRLARRSLAEAEASSGMRTNSAELSVLGVALQRLFEVAGTLPVLDEAIDVTRRAALAAEGPGMALQWSNLANALRTRFIETGDRTALDEAVDAARRACTNPRLRAADLAMFQLNLGLVLASQSDSVRLADLREAVDLLRAASETDGVAAADRALYLHQLAWALSLLSRRTADPEHQRAAVECDRRAVSLAPATPTGLQIRGQYVRNLLRLHLIGQDAALPAEADAAARELLRISGSRLVARTRAELLIISVACVKAEIGALTEALRLVEDRQGGAEAPEFDDYPAQMNVGQLYRSRYLEGEQQPRHLEAARACYRRAITLARPGRDRLAACRALAELPITDDTSAQEALGAAETAVSVLPQAITRGAEAADQAYATGQLAGLPALVASAALAAGRPLRAVELLEATRGLLAAAVFDLEDAAVLRLRERAPAFADEFDSLRAKLARLEQRKAVAVGDRQRTTLTRDERALHEEWERLLLRIKELPGLHGFPAVHDGAELTLQAREGPIVFVTSDRRRCDALVLTGDPARPVLAIELPAARGGEAGERISEFLQAQQAIADPDTDLRARRQAQRRITETLGWTWDAIAAPVLDRLERERLTPRQESGALPRLWWCPVGALAYLPLHAAGRVLDVGDGTTRRFEGVPDRVVSSYTPTVRALSRARAAAGSGADPTRSTLAVIAEPGGDGIPVLAGAEAEAQAVLDAVSGAVLLDRPGQAEVRAALAEFAAVHFTCHAVADMMSPQDSELILRDYADNPLAVADIWKARVTTAQLAYLSACATALTGPALADESLHLTASFQIAGFRHVIGTLWPVRDTAAQAIATDFYDALTANRSRSPDFGLTARALHRATVSARERYEGRSPTLWAAHIHVGP